MASVGGGQFSNEKSSSVLIGESDLAKRCEEGSKLLDQLEQCWQSKGDLENRYGRYEAILKNLQQQNRSTSPEFLQYSQQLRDTTEKLLQVRALIPALENKAARSLEAYIGACESLSSAIGQCLEQWKWQQKANQYGVVMQNDNLAEITKRYQNAMEHAFAAWRLLCRFHSMRGQQQQQASGQTTPSSPAVDNTLQILCRRTQMVFYHILNSSFAITIQPPMVVKNKIKLEVTLLAAIDKLGLEAQSVQLYSKIVSEDTAAELKASPDLMMQKIPTVGHLDGAAAKTKQLQRLSSNTLGFELKNIKVTVESRKQATKTGEAIMKKYYFLFTTDITFDNQIFKLSTFSLPFMVSVHGTQDVELYARGFWDMAFSDSLDTVPMIGATEVRWHAMGPAIEAIFSLLTKGNRRLTQHDAEYLKYRIFNGVVLENDPVVTWQQFYKERLERIGGNINEPRRRCTFSFWEWLFRIGDMIQEKSGRDTGVSAMWEERFIEGFISKHEADARLLQAPQPMMMIRFSDNQLAGLGIVCQNPHTKEIDHLIPFKFKEEIEKLTLPTVVVNCKEVKNVQIIYPDKPKEKVEQMVSANKRSEEIDYFDQYKKRTLVIQSGERGGRAPSPLPGQFAPGAINKVSTPMQSLTASFPKIKLEQSPAPPSANGYTTHTSDLEYPNDFSVRMQNDEGQFQDLDDQTMQCILRELANSNDDEEMDAFVRMVQTFDSTTADYQANGTSPQQNPNSADSPTINFDFDMS